MTTAVGDLLADAVAMLTEMDGDPTRAGTVLASRMGTVEDVARTATTALLAAQLLADLFARAVDLDREEVLRRVGLEALKMGGAT